MPDAQYLIEYHVLVSGSCWAGLVDGRAPLVELRAGSIVMFPHGDAHARTSEPNMRSGSDFSAYVPPMLEGQRPFAMKAGGDGPQDARIICGFLAATPTPSTRCSGRCRGSCTWPMGPATRMAGWVY